MELPSVHVTRAVIQRYARVITRLGDDLGKRPLVLPNSQFFPDVFTSDQVGAQRLADRMRTHAGMDDIPVRLLVANATAGDNSCSSGACAPPLVASGDLERLVDTGDEWELNVLETELKHPTVLTTNIARALSYIFLVETKDEEEVVEPPVDVTADMIGVGLGFGALLIQGSYIYAKSCGGPSVAKLTKMSCGELALSLSAFMMRGGHKLRPVVAELDVTQSALLKEVHRLLDANRFIVSALRNDPAALIDGGFDITQERSWLGKLFGEKNSKDSDLDDSSLALGEDVEALEKLLIDMPPSSSVGRPSRPPAEPDPAKEELRQLVSEALAAPRQTAGPQRV